MIDDTNHGCRARACLSIVPSLCKKIVRCGLELNKCFYSKFQNNLEFQLYGIWARITASEHSFSAHVPVPVLVQGRLSPIFT